MYKLLIFLFYFLFFSQFCYCETVWDTRKDIFMDYIKQGEELKEQKQEKIDAQIQLDLNIRNINMNLEECLDIALQNNINMKIARHNMDAAKWEFRSKLAEFVPNVSGTFKMSQLRGTFLVGNVALDLVHEIPISVAVLAEYNAFQNNKIFFETKIRDLMKQSTINSNNFTKDEVLLNTTLRYYELLKAKLNIEVLRTNVLDREEQMRLTEGRYLVGIGEKFDVLRADAELQIAKQELVTELNTLRFAQAKLARVMGIDMLSPIYPTDIDIKTIKLYDGDYDIDNIYNLAMKIRPDIKAKELELKAKKVERNSNYGDYIPQLYFYYQYSQSGLASTGIRFGDTVAMEARIPVGKNLGVKTYTSYKQADENFKKASWELLTYKRDIKQRILESVYNSSAALEKIEASKKEIKAAQRSVDTAVARFEIGNATFLDVINAQATKTSARQKLINNVIEYNIAQINLLFESGTITAGEIIEKYNQQK